MGMLKKILAPTDFSDISAAGVRYACRLAKDTGAEIIIFNVDVLDESNRVDKREIEQHRKRLAEFVTEKVADAALRFENAPARRCRPALRKHRRLRREGRRRLDRHVLAWPQRIVTHADRQRHG